ncbi:MAG: JAB domain-containing protein [Patescibacteria group bacterium]
MYIGFVLYIKELDMTFHHLSHLDLLSLLVGSKKAQKLYQGSLTTLLYAEEGSKNYVPKLAVARELVRLSLEEKLYGEDVFSSPYTVKEYLKVLLHGREHEVFVVLFLTTQHHLILAEELFRGTLAGASVHPREVVKRALALNAASVIFAHNHPSGVAEPSAADTALTMRLKDALALVEVSVLDHFVVTGSAVVSMAERGLM